MFLIIITLTTWIIEKTEVFVTRTLNGIFLNIFLLNEKSGWWVIKNVLILEKTGVAGSQLPRTKVRGN